MNARERSTKEPAAVRELRDLIQQALEAIERLERDVDAIEEALRS